MTTMIVGDLLDIKNGIICHQTNCRKVANAGLARQIREKWPQWYVDFLETTPALGRATFWRATITPELYVANLYAQFDFGHAIRKGMSKRFTNYNALRCCLMDVKKFAKRRLVYIPVGLGCGLAGGSWEVVENMIEMELPDAILVQREDVK